MEYYNIYTYLKDQLLKSQQILTKINIIVKVYK